MAQNAKPRSVPINGTATGEVVIRFDKVSFEYGAININKNLTIAVSRQVIPRDHMDLTVREFFEKCFAKKVYDIDPRIDKALEAVNFKASHEKIIKSFS